MTADRQWHLSKVERCGSGVGGGSGQDHAGAHFGESSATRLFGWCLPAGHSAERPETTHALKKQEQSLNPSHKWSARATGGRQVSLPQVVINS